MSTLTWDQRRANHSYKAVAALKNNDALLKSYKVLVNSLGPNIIRSGFAGALAFVQRYSDDGARKKFGEDLAQGFPKWMQMGDSLGSMMERVRSMPIDDYIVATRECIKLAQWLKRATQAHANGES